MRYLILLISLLCSTQAIGQTKFSWELGLSYSTHFFIHEDKNQFDDSFFKPDIAHLPRINSFFDLNINSAFQFRLNLSLGEKKVVLSNRLVIPSTGGTLKTSINHEVLSADLSFLSYYSIGKIRPLFGFYISTNQYAALTQTTSTRNGQVDETNIPSVILEVEEYPFILYAGINLGISYSTKIKNRDIELVSLFYFSPSDMFSSDFTYKTNSVQQTITGKYHYVSLGANLKLKRKK